MKRLALAAVLAYPVGVATGYVIFRIYIRSTRV